MRALIIIAVTALAALPAASHPRSEHGSITAPTWGVSTVQADGLPPLFSLVESVAPGTVPNGLFFYAFCCVTVGETVTVTADDGQDPISAGPLTLYDPDLDVHCGDASSGFGPVESVVCTESGSVVVWLICCKPGEGFTFTES